jgi:DNA-binding response OmpR family regulator
VKTVMVVEDHEDLRAFVAEEIRYEGYEVSEASSAEEALWLLDNMVGKPCLILLDRMLPGMSGGEFLQRLDDSKRLDSLPVVMISAAPNAEGSRGARLVLRKPIDPRYLIEVVRNFCGSPY